MIEKHTKESIVFYNLVSCVHCVFSLIYKVYMCQLIMYHRISTFTLLQGVVCLILVVDGSIKKGDQVTSHHSGKSYEVKNLGILAPHEISTVQL